MFHVFGKLSRRKCLSDAVRLRGLMRMQAGGNARRKGLEVKINAIYATTS